MWIQLKVNGKDVSAQDPEQSLLRFLRDDLGLIGTKDGCSRGQCGTCTVIVNGKAVRSCARKMKSLEGAEVQTIEGLAKDGELHPLQTAFLKRHAYQCGFCTPGLIMAAKALVDANPHPTDEEIKHALRFNICRCTGYVQVLEAVRLAIDIMDGKASVDLYDNKGWVGDSPITKHGIERVTGAALFTDDFKLDHPLEGRLKFTEYPHARILSIDKSEALKQPGVVFIATAQDIPGTNEFSQPEYPQQVLAEEKVRFIGEPVAVVYAETAEQAYAAMPYIKVEYEVLPVVRNQQEGYDPASCRVHDQYPNAYYNKKIRKGNVERALAKADIVLEQDVRTQTVEHGSLEPDVALAEYDERGRLVVSGPGQNPTHMRHNICHALKISESQIRLITRPSGGSFGKRENQVCHIFAALGAYHTKRPVRVILSRAEVNNLTTKRHAIDFHYKLGATKDGKLLGIKAKTITDTGAYSALGDFLATCTAAMGTGPYEVPNIDFDSTAVFTNKVVAECFRGYGSTQVTVMVETLMDRLAEACGLSPFDVRRINGLAVGKQNSVGQIIEYGCGFHEAVAEVERQLKADGIPTPSGPGKKIGVGVAGGFKNMGFGCGFEDGAGAKISLTPEGRFLLHTGAVELGQGHDTVICQIAAETLGVNYHHIDIGPVDDDYSPYAKGSTSASRMTYCSGNAVMALCVKYKEKLFQYVADRFGQTTDHLDTDMEGVYDVRREEAFRKSYAEIGRALAEEGKTLEEEYYYVAGVCFPPKEQADNIDKNMLDHRFQVAYCFALQAAIVEVDEQTGQVKVLRMYAADDCGRAINPGLVRGQIIGSAVMGMGYALSENFPVKDGYNQIKEYKDLGLPKFTDMPEVHPIYIEEVHPFGPFGAKGFGEMALNPAAPAILNAIYDAVGVRITTLPVDAAKLAAAINSPDHAYGEAEIIDWSPYARTWW